MMTDKEMRYYQAAILEKIDKAAYAPQATRFLDMAQRQWLDKTVRGIPIVWDGGYPDAERAVALLGQGTEALRTVTVIAVRWSTFDKLTHRDILGALMALGCERDVFGDILMGDHIAYVMMLRTHADDIIRRFVSAGRATVSCEEVAEAVLPEQTYRIVSGTLASLRLDALIDVGFDMSRGKAADAVRMGLVKLNGLETLKPDKAVQQGDKVSLRGKGRILLETVGRTTAKGRIAVTVHRYGG